VVRPADSWWAQVLLAGDVDATASLQLADAIDDLTDASVASVFVDVAAVGSADAVLLNFLVVLRVLLPAGASLAVCRPRPPVRRVLEAAGMDHVWTLRSDLPLLDVSPRRKSGT
jgi:anti-anti-sigma factor